MHKQPYICPDLTVVRFSLTEVVCSSPEHSTTIIDDGGGNWGGDDLDDL